MKTEDEIRKEIARLSKDYDEWAKGRDLYLSEGNEAESENCSVAMKGIEKQIRLLKWALGDSDE